MIVMRIAITPSLNASSRAVVIRALRTRLVHSRAIGDGALDLRPDRAMASHEALEVPALEDEQLAVRERDDVRLSRLIEHECHLAEEIAACEQYRRARRLTRAPSPSRPPDAMKYIASPRSPSAISRSSGTASRGRNSRATQ